MLCQFERGKHDTFVRGSVAFVTGEGSVMYKSLRTRKSDYVQRLRLVKLVVPFVSRPEQLMSLFGKGTCFPPAGHLAFHPKADRFLPSLYFLL